MSVLRKNLRAITADGAASNLMVGIGENYLPAFVLALSGSQLACGLAATVPLVLGGVMQLATPWMLARMRSHRRWTVLCAVLQALSFLPLLAAALTQSLDLMSVFLVIALYWSCGMTCNSTWNAWVETLVPERIRARYFALRTRFGQFSLLLGFVLGGISLQIGAQRGYRFLAFALLFFLAAGSRLVSALALGSQQEAAPLASGQKIHLFRDFFDSIRSGSNGSSIFFILLMQGACYISGPYFTPFMLGNLKFSYLQFVILTAVAYLAKVASLGFWGRVIDRWGVPATLCWSGLAIAPLPTLWNFSHAFAYLAALQVLSGTVWAAYELAVMLLFFESIPHHQKISVLTIYNFVNAAAIMAGSLIGGWLLLACGGGREAYHAVFWASTLSRVGALSILIRLPARIAQKAGELFQEFVPGEFHRSRPIFRRFPDSSFSEADVSHKLREREAAVKKAA